MTHSFSLTIPAVYVSFPLIILKSRCLFLVIVRRQCLLQKIVLATQHFNKVNVPIVLGPLPVTSAMASPYSGQFYIFCLGDLRKNIIVKKISPKEVANMTIKRRCYHKNWYNIFSNILANFR